MKFLAALVSLSTILCNRNDLQKPLIFSSDSRENNDQKIILTANDEKHSINTLDSDNLFPSQWKVLGPFNAGTRELGWDPLSSYGGFERLADLDTDMNDHVSHIPSEMVDGGFAVWSSAVAIDNRVGWDLSNRKLPQVRWDFNQRSFGWASLQHSVYYKATFHVQQAGSYSVSFNGKISRDNLYNKHFLGVTSFKIDNMAYPGNTYSYSHASSSIIHLEEGSHSVYISTQFDVRRDGSSIPPITFFNGSIHPVNPLLVAGMAFYPQDTILPDIMDGALISKYASITLRNTRPVLFSRDSVDQERKRHRESTGWTELLRLNCYNAETMEKIETSIIVSYTITFAPGQIFAIPFKFDSLENPPSTIKFEVVVLDIDTNQRHSFFLAPLTFTRREWSSSSQGYKITMDGYDNSIQYAYVKPPFENCLAWTLKRCPVVVALHGAGVKVESPFWLNSVSQQRYAWVVFPSGRTEWGFDWHGPSFKNVEASVEGIITSPGVPFALTHQFMVATDRLVVVGHSNGGQGAWWLASHYPDRVLAALPASGFMKIQMYVPYYLHGGYSYADPSVRGLMEASISENDLDLYTSNMAGIPILARTGSDDTNVPPIHTRKLVRLVKEWGDGKTDNIHLVEDQGKGHWYDGVLNDSIAQKFLNDNLDPQSNPNLDLPSIPNPFTISTMNPASTGPKCGISILQPIVPYRISTIHVHREGDHWTLTTKNVRRFGFVRDERQTGIRSWSIDHTTFRTPPEDSGPSYLNKGNGTWELSSDLLWISRERNPTTYGPAFQIFSHAFKIVVPSSPSANLTLYRFMAQQIANSWYLYGRGSVQIIRDVDVLDGITARYNLIVLGDPRVNQYTLSRTKAGTSKLLQFLPDGGIQIRDSVFNSPGTGSIFLAPSSARTRLGLFITGIDADGLLRALWTIPFRTGIQVPDYTIMSEEYGDPCTGWMSKSGIDGEPKTKGIGGILALGYWNFEWNFLESAGFRGGSDPI